LALLRTLCQIADGACGYAKDVNDAHVAIPFGLVGLYWVRLFKPLLAADLPQTPKNCGYEKLGFVKDGFRRLKDVSHLDLRIGMPFAGQRSDSLHSALREACNTIKEMPIRFMCYPGGGSVLTVNRSGRVPHSSAIRLDEHYLSSFGELVVPRHLWRALQRFGVWIEPAIIAEWSRLINVYAERQNRKIPAGAIALAMTWSDPKRDVRVAREQALQLIEATTLECVWSGRVLTAESLDIDHCFPWTAWPCDDLWNLLPAHRNVNQRQKREKLPSIKLLRFAQHRIQSRWDRGYLNAGNQLLAERFMTEAKASLPMIDHDNARLDDVFAAMSLQQLRLKNDQQVPLWEPNTG
jgi:hypothetical protein